jgi:hypothetical protein
LEQAKEGIAGWDASAWQLNVVAGQVLSEEICLPLGLQYG